MEEKLFFDNCVVGNCLPYKLCVVEWDGFCLGLRFVYASSGDCVIYYSEYCQWMYFIHMENK